MTAESEFILRSNSAADGDIDSYTDDRVRGIIRDGDNNNNNKIGIIILLSSSSTTTNRRANDL